MTFTWNFSRFDKRNYREIFPLFSDDSVTPAQESFKFRPGSVTAFFSKTPSVVRRLAGGRWWTQTSRRSLHRGTTDKLYTVSSNCGKETQWFYPSMYRSLGQSQCNVWPSFTYTAEMQASSSVFFLVISELLEPHYQSLSGVVTIFVSRTTSVEFIVYI